MDATQERQTQVLPLAGVRVLEFVHMVMGPSCGLVLADLGAEVIKIEPPEGDNTRRLTGTGAGFWATYNRNKKSLALDLKSAAGLEIVKKLLATADVAIENFRPGTLEKWNLGYETLAKENAGLVMLRLSGFGQDGPMRGQAGFGTVAESMGGLRYVTGFPDGAPVRPNLSIGDSIAALHGVIGVLTALRHRDRNGKGQVVDVAL